MVDEHERALTEGAVRLIKPVTAIAVQPAKQKTRGK